MILTADRLSLVPWRGDEWRDLLPLATDPEHMRYISCGQPWSVEHVQEFVNRQVAHYAKYEFCSWRLLLGEHKTFAGFCRLQPLAGTDEIEIGWWLARGYWGQRLATEAARAAMQDGFARCGLARIIAIAMPANQTSIGVMKKLSMRFEREYVHKGFPTVLYAISREEYSAASLE
jgi:ribosomal-protein-alanine N-acetyltransferase